MTTIRCCALVIAALLWPPLAHDGRSCYGEYERAMYVMYVTPEKSAKPTLIRPPHLSRLLTFHCFMFPYSVTDSGYVLTTRDTYGPYEHVSDAQVAELQRQGRLPDPLPPFEIPWSDWLVGHMLWFLPVASAASVVIGRLFQRRRSVRLRS